MRVILNTYPSAFAMPGGGERQIMDIHAELPAQGIQPLLYDLWQPRLDEADLVHFFSVASGSLPFCTHVKDYGLPLILSPNMWIDSHNATSFDLDEITALLQIADAIIVNSYVEADNLHSILDIPESKINVVHSGISESFMTQADPELVPKTIGIEGQFLLCIGSLHPHKNQLSLIQAVKRFPATRLLLFGHIRDEAYANLCMKEGGEQVIYAGSVPHSADLLKSTMAACSAFILPSFSESPSIASIEAAAQGANLILTRIGSQQEYFGDHAQYIDPHDIDGISEAIRIALENNGRNDALREITLKQYTISNSCDKVAAVYRNLFTGGT